MTPDQRSRQRSRALHHEADQLLDYLHLRKLCAPIGKLTLTGSCFMDLMMYPDIDVYLPPTTPRELLNLAGSLAEFETVERITYLRGGPGDLRDGLYIKPVVRYGDWERPWKVDIWSLPEGIIQTKQAELGSLKARMTPEQRTVILNTKHQLLTDEFRTPMFSGIFIYRAVVIEGLVTLDDIVGYLRDNGIRV